MTNLTQCTSYSQTLGKIDWGGLVALLIFYFAIAFAGVLAAWLRKRRNRVGDVSKAADTIVAGRDIGLAVGVFTMIATWVGGGFLNGTSEYTYQSGLLNVQACFGYSISLALNGIFFARQFREKEYLTMIDPFQIKYGRRIGALMYLPALSGELLWSAAILNALGATVSVVLGLNRETSVIVSVIVAIVYTFIGGLYSVAFTDVIQLLCITFGLLLCIPFAFTSSCVDLTLNRDIWGTVTTPLTYVDDYLMLIFGGMPWQVYFQRVLSMRTSNQAVFLSFAGGLGCFLFSLPPAALGIAAMHLPDNSMLKAAIDSDPTMTLPLVIRYLTPTVVGYIGLGAVSAAVMSSTDSSILSCSSMFAHNIFREAIWQTASDRVVLWVLRGSIIVLGAVACLIALAVPQVYVLFYLCSDLVYCILFPQLVCVIYLAFVNSYGVLTGSLVALVIRLLCGSPKLGIPSLLPEAMFEFIPMKTSIMITNMIITLLVSFITLRLLKNRPKMDVLGCYREHNRNEEFELQRKK